VPVVGLPATVVDLDAQTPAVVAAVWDGGRRLAVETEEGERLEFTLRGATAVYTVAADSNWPRLRLN
jgi:hypothetical protein